MIELSNDILKPDSALCMECGSNEIKYGNATVDGNNIIVANTCHACGAVNNHHLSIISNGWSTSSSPKTSQLRYTLAEYTATITPSQVKPTRKKRVTMAYTDDFELFWEEYPRRTGKGKAFEEWIRAKSIGVSQDTIINAVKIQCGNGMLRLDDPQYIPMPATWLHQRRWDDEGCESVPTKEATPESEYRTKEEWDEYLKSNPNSVGKK